MCGLCRPEIEMFGTEHRDHDARHRMADEWLSVITQAWTEQDFDHHGEFYDIKGGFLLPKPVQQPYPTLINAGSSEAGREFSARHVDYNFITITTEDEAQFLIKDVRERAAAHRRECGVMTYGLVCCRDTEAEARELHDSIVRHGDWEATENIMKMLGIESSSFGNKDAGRNLGERFIAGWGGYPLVGTPEQVVEKMLAIHAMGIDGFILSWLDYAQELEYFGERVMPLLRQAGLRV